jgi:hypothetical protein
MGYFDFIPSVAYPNDEGGRTIVKDILVRGKIIDALREAASAALEYTVEDEEKPETLAYRIYGRADYHWLILLFNEIHDPFFSWPMSINEMEKHMEASYSGKALFIDPVGLWDYDKELPLDRRVPHFAKGDLIQQKDVLGSVVATAEVISWDPNLYKVVVDSVSGSFRLVGEAARHTSVISDRTALTRDITTVNSTGKTITVPLVRITDDNRYALQRFENSSQEEISPWFRAKGNPTPIIEKYALGRSEVFPMGDNEVGEDLGNATIVTNIENEERINDAKRTIKVMRPEYIDLVLRDFRSLF